MHRILCRSDEALMSGLSPVIKTQEHKTYAAFTPAQQVVLNMLCWCKCDIRHSALCLSQPWPWGVTLHDVTMSQCLPGSEWVSECVEFNVPVDTVDDAGHYCYCCLDHHIITAHINSVACAHWTGTQTHQTQSEDDTYTSTWAVTDLGGGAWEKHRVISDLCVTARNVDLAVLLIWPIVGNCELTVDSFSTVFENVGFVKFS